MLKFTTLAVNRVIGSYNGKYIWLPQLQYCHNTQLINTLQGCLERSFTRNEH
jgi:hypothetical protein